tara:strand:+ start:68 stop:601 length:534 start_codon:yes stop_codon:yes gene_type:complete
VKRNIYEDVITRRRWKLIEAVWLLHGVFIKTDKAYAAALELFYDGEVEQHHDDQEQEVGRLSQDFIDRMLNVDVSNSFTAVHVEDWRICNDQDDRLKEGIKKFWHLLNCNSDIRQCEVSYVDENGKWYALAPESQWNADYLIDFAKDQGFDVQWLIDERYKKIATKDNVIPFRKRNS